MIDVLAKVREALEGACNYADPTCAEAPSGPKCDTCEALALLDRYEVVKVTENCGELFQHRLYPEYEAEYRNRNEAHDRPALLLVERET